MTNSQEIVKDALNRVGKHQQRAANRADDIECAHIKLRGSVERMLLLLQYRSDNNYRAGTESLHSAWSEYRRVVYGETPQEKK